MKHEEKSEPGSSRSPNRALWRRLRQLLRADTAGQSFVEYLVVAGFCALVGVFGFKQYGSAVQRDLVADAKHIEGEGLPNTENLLSSLGVDYNALPGWCVKPNYCFAAGTLVETESGDRPIEGIAVGERVWARDVTTGAVALRTVLNTYRTADVPVVDLELRSGFATRERIAVTPGHLFWVEGAGWLPAESLSEQSLWSTEAPVTANVGSVSAAPTTVYNLEVAEFHSYFVGHAHVLVHNGDPSGGDCVQIPPSDPPPKKPRIVLCGESGKYGADLNSDYWGDKANYRASPGLQRDHIPSGKALETRSEKVLDDLVEQQMEARCRDLTPTEWKALETKVDAMKKDAKAGLKKPINNDGFVIAVPTALHEAGRTYQNKNKPLFEQDSKDLHAAAQADIAEYERLLGIARDKNGNLLPAQYKGPLTEECKQLIIQALDEIRNKTDAQYEAEMEQLASQQLQAVGFTALIQDACPETEQTKN